jgi:6-phosphogluconate dehydrogenase
MHASLRNAGATVRVAAVTVCATWRHGANIRNEWMMRLAELEHKRNAGALLISNALSNWEFEKCKSWRNVVTCKLQTTVKSLKQMRVRSLPFGRRLASVPRV